MRCGCARRGGGGGGGGADSVKYQPHSNVFTDMMRSALRPRRSGFYADNDDSSPPQAPAQWRAEWAGAEEEEVEEHAKKKKNGNDEGAGAASNRFAYQGKLRPRHRPSRHRSGSQPPPPTPPSPSHAQPQRLSSSPFGTDAEKSPPPASLWARMLRWVVLVFMVSFFARDIGHGLRLFAEDIGHGLNFVTGSIPRTSGAGREKR